MMSNHKARCFSTFNTSEMTSEYPRKSPCSETTSSRVSLIIFSALRAVSMSIVPIKALRHIRMPATCSLMYWLCFCVSSIEAAICFRRPVASSIISSSMVCRNIHGSGRGGAVERMSGPALSVKRPVRACRTLEAGGAA